MNHNLKKQINDYYWNELEEQSNGYGDPYPLERIQEEFNITLTWKQLYEIFKENEYKL